MFNLTHPTRCYVKPFDQNAWGNLVTFKKTYLAAIHALKQGLKLPEATSWAGTLDWVIQLRLV